MTSECLTVLNKLAVSVDNANTELIKNMIDDKTDKKKICVRTNVSYDFYFQRLKRDWDEILGSHSGSCLGLSSLRKFASMDLSGLSGSNATGVTSMDKNQMMDKALDLLIDQLLSPGPSPFSMSEDAVETFSNLVMLLLDRCSCPSTLLEIIQAIFAKYRDGLRKKLGTVDKAQIKKMIYDNFDALKKLVTESNKINDGTSVTPKVPGEIAKKKEQLLTRLTETMTGLFSFSVAGELDRLIPNELGNMKEFFIKVISTYYEKLHPIIWAQMYKKACDEVFIDLPVTKEEWFQFVSKQVLLNSGPFILKIIQMIRPILSDELRTKYNLTSLSKFYPKLTPKQIDMVLTDILDDRHMYKVIARISASVGDVSIVERVDDIDHPLIIKVIKPLSIAQSCWEYATLGNIFDPIKEKCECDFVKGMLESNGEEFDVINENKNITDAYGYYTTNYNEIYGYNLDADLTTIQVIPNVVKPNCWFATALSLAPGLPLSTLVEGGKDQLLNDTKYRARLHRCLDLLVSKFFFVILQHGFYHGDLHAGNIFFSYKHNQMTLIDFGGVGRLNVFEENPDIAALIEIIVMSIFYNYDDLLDKMTDLLNSKCDGLGKIIDKANDAEYIKLKEELKKDKIHNIKYQKITAQNSDKYISDLFSEDRLSHEASKYSGLDETQHEQVVEKEAKSIYEYYEMRRPEKEGVIENDDILPKFTDVQPSKSVSFDKILLKIFAFYAKAGINVPIKFSEFYQFQKAYTLLLGVLDQVHYSSYRSGLAIKKAILNTAHINKLRHFKWVINAIRLYRTQRNKYNEFIKTMGINPESVEDITISPVAPVSPVTSTVPAAPAGTVPQRLAIPEEKPILSNPSQQEIQRILRDDFSEISEKIKQKTGKSGKDLYDMIFKESQRIKEQYSPQFSAAKEKASEVLSNVGTKSSNGREKLMAAVGIKVNP